MGKIKKERRWLPHKLIENAIVNCLNISMSLFAVHEEIESKMQKTIS